MKAIILTLACEECGSELVWERDKATLAIRCIRSGCKFFNQRFEPPTVKLQAVESSVDATT